MDYIENWWKRDSLEEKYTVSSREFLKRNDLEIPASFTKYYNVRFV